VTVVVAGVAFLLATALAWGSVAVGRAAAAGARAQLAADAAALAAVAESAPYGGGRPVEVAADYAGANGARLVECRCDEGATTMQVRVEVDGVEGEARAHLDPELLAPATGATGMDPRLADAVRRLLDAAGDRVHVVSGFRSTERQAELWAAALERYGSAEIADDWVARPGSSMHERGVAVDLGGDVGLAVRLTDELDLPLHRPLPHEPWHFELSGSRDAPD
jgi:hypothetical protein